MCYASTLRPSRRTAQSSGLGSSRTCADRATVALALLDGEPVGTAYALGSDGGAGLAAYLAGVAVLPDARSRGFASAMSARLLERAFAADLAHLHPDSDVAARIYGRLGFMEVAGFDIYVDLG